MQLLDTCRYLAEGILPTTNEISVLKFLEDGEKELVQNSDGFFIRRLPAPLLREMNVVDTPGTNVILDRQQRLTEEYVPRADLVLFVISADRPFTESEVNFLKYIRQWGKKVVFLVNKVRLFLITMHDCCAWHLEQAFESKQRLAHLVEHCTRVAGFEPATFFGISRMTKQWMISYFQEHAVLTIGRVTF